MDVTGAIDCDVHCAPTSYDDLAPYLSAYWRQYISEAAVRLTAVAHAYPPNGPVAVSAAARARGETAAPATFEQLGERYLRVAEPELGVINCITTFDNHRNPYFSAAVASAVNDWVREEFLSRDERLRAGLVVSPLSPQDAVAEIERLGDDERFVHILLPVRSEIPWGNKNNHPIFAAAQERSMPIALHAWGRPGKAPTPSGFTSTYLEDYVANQAIAQAQVVSLVSEGVFGQFSELRVLVAECGFTWLPTLLWRFDKDWKGVWREVPWVKDLPSAYVARHVRLTTAPAHLPEDPGERAQLVEMLGGVASLAYASDFPHNHGSSIGSLLDELQPDDRWRVLHGTAAELYGLATLQGAT